MILLTGSNGFLGKFLYNQLSIRHKIISLHQVERRYKFNIELDELLRYNEIDLFIYAAGKTPFKVGNSINNSIFFEINVETLRELLKLLENSTLPKSFVYLSSVSVYGLISGNFVNEDSPLIANEPYGQSKIKAEALLQNWCSKFGVNLTILRLPLVVGQNAPGNLGSMINAINYGSYFNIGSGTAKKSMVLIDDIGKYILKASRKGGIYNLTDGYHPSLYEFSTLIANQLNKRNPYNIPISLAESLAKLGDFFGINSPFNSERFLKLTNTLTFDDSKAKIAFGWNPRPVLEEFKIF